MNYLAHFYLSNNDEGLIVGNYIADDVKGKAYLKYAPQVQKGILLHRKIDDFTDTHQVVEKSKERIRTHQNKYTPVVMDVFYDYFLSNNWSLYSSMALSSFIQHIYYVLLKNINTLPPKSQERLTFMVQENWLHNYKSIQGIEQTLTNMAKRTKYENNMSQAYLILQAKEQELNADFKHFFPDLIACVNDNLQTDER